MYANTYIFFNFYRKQKVRSCTLAATADTNFTASTANSAATLGNAIKVAFPFWAEAAEAAAAAAAAAAARRTTAAGAVTRTTAKKEYDWFHYYNL